VQKKQIIALVVAVVLGLFAVLATMSQMKEIAESEQKKGKKALERLKANQTVVLVAKQDIPPGTVLQSGMFEPAIVLKEHAQPQTASSIDAVVGMVTIAPIGRGEQLMMTKLSTGGPRQQVRRDLSSTIPIGKRAVPVMVENISELTGLIKPGDFVDVIAVLNVPVEEAEEKQTKKSSVPISQQTILPVFQNVQVLAVGTETSPESAGQQKAPRSAANPAITVALTPTEANILTFLQEQGTIRMSLRSMQEVQIETVKPITWDNIFEYVPALNPKGADQETIEIYRGLKHERIPITK